MPTMPDRRLNAWRADLADEQLKDLVAAPRYVAGVPRQIVAAAAPLRRAPRPDAALDTEALCGERVNVFDEAEGWVFGQLETDGYVGYLPAEALGSVGPPPTHRVSALRTFVFPAADLKQPPTACLSLGATLAATRHDDRYMLLADGGFVRSVHLAPVASFEVDFVAVAERFLGTPYLWGGKTSIGLDCSGLVQVSMAAAGRNVLRDSDMQEATIGEALGPDAADAQGGLRRGDILCWPGHVGIMVDATRLLHANAFHNETVIEPVAEAISRIAAAGSPLRQIRRPSTGRSMA